MGFSLDGGLAFVTRGPTVKLVELQSGRRRDMWRLPVLHPDQVLVGPEGRFVVARDVNGAVAASTEADTTVELAPAGRGRAVSASIDGVVLVSEAGTLRTFDVRTHAAPREIRSDARGLIACWLDLRRPTIACVAEGDRLVLLDARSGATILDYKAKPEAGSSAWRIEPPPVNGAMITMDAAQNGFESWDVGPALDVYDTLARLGPGARRDWVRTSLAHEAGR